MRQVARRSFWTLGIIFLVPVLTRRKTDFSTVMMGQIHFCQITLALCDELTGFNRTSHMPRFSRGRCRSDKQVIGSNIPSEIRSLLASLPIFAHKRQASSSSYYISKSPSDLFTSSQTQCDSHLSLSLIASVSASDAAAGHCPLFRTHSDQCSDCNTPKYVSTDE
jgi:hypothetical protein